MRPVWRQLSWMLELLLRQQAVGHYAWANLATIDIVLDIFRGQRTSDRGGLVPNCMIMTDSVFSRIRRSTKIQTFLYGTIGAGTGCRLINTRDIGAALGIPNIYIAAATMTVPNKGQTPDLTQVWGNTYIWIGYVAPEVISVP